MYNHQRMGKMKARDRMDFMALVAPLAKIRRQHLLKADLHRLKKVVGNQLRAGLCNGDFILYSSDVETFKRLVSLLAFFSEFREQRVDPIRNKVELIEIVDKDDPLFA